MGPRYLETVLTCMGDYYSPDFHRQLSEFREQLQQLIIVGDDRSLILKKVEPWNSVRVTFNIPADAAERLRELAQHPNSVLRELGVLAVQIAGDHVMSVSADSAVCKDTQPSDVIAAASASQAVCQASSGVVVPTDDQLAKQSAQQFKVPTSFVPNCCPGVLSTTSVVTGTASVECPLPGTVSNLSIAQPRPVRMVRWPAVVRGPSGMDAVAVRFAVPAVPMKEFSQDMCFISPLRPGVNQNIASSSPLLVNLLQTRRQQGITAIPSQAISPQPVIPLDTSTLLLPQKRRRSTPSRKPKQLRGEELVVPVTSLMLATDSTLHAGHGPVAPAATVCSSMTVTCDSAAVSTISSTPIVSLSEQSCSARHMINPYTGSIELVDMAEEDGLNVLVSSSALISSGSSSQPAIETAVMKNTALSNNNESMSASGIPKQWLPNSVPHQWSLPTVSTNITCDAKLLPSESGTSAAVANLQAKNGPVPSTESITVLSLSLSRSPVATTSRYVDWYTASQSDKHNRSLSDNAQSLFTIGSSSTKNADAAQMGLMTSAENLGNNTKTEACPSVQPCKSAMKPLSTIAQPSITSLPNSSNVGVLCTEPDRSTQDGILQVHRTGNFSASSSSVSQLSSGRNDLMQMAFTLAKQNGNALHVSSLVDNWPKNAGLLQSSLQCLQSVHGMHSIAVTAPRIPFHSPSTVSSVSLSVQSRANDAAVATNVTTVASSDTCFFPAVSCFPPEHRRRLAMNIGGLGINSEMQLQPCTTSGIITSAVPLVKILASTSMPPEAKSCGISLLPSTTTNFSTVTGSVATECSTLPAGMERTTVYNPDVKKTIPLIANLTPSSWPLMPNLLTVPLVNPTPLSGSPLLHCVTRAPLTPDGKLAGVSAAVTVTNPKSSIVPLAGRLCIPLPSSSQAGLVSSGGDMQNIQTSMLSGIRPPTIMLTDNVSKFKLSVSSKPSAKQGVSKDRRGTSVRVDDTATPRGSGKSHLTVAQLLDMAKNARLHHTSGDDLQVKISEQQSDHSASVVTSASLQPQPALTISPPKNLLQLSSLPLQSSSVVIASHDQSHAQLVPLRLSSGVASSIHTCPTASIVLQTSAAHPLLSLSTAASTIVPLSTASAAASCSQSTAQPFTGAGVSSTTTHTNIAAVDVPGKACVETAFDADRLVLNSFLASTSVSLPISSFSTHPPLPITSPRYPLNLTESVKKAMRGVGLYPSPPISPVTPVHTFPSLNVPEIRPYPVSAVCRLPASELLKKKLVQDESVTALGIKFQQPLTSEPGCTGVSCVTIADLLVSTAVVTTSLSTTGVDCIVSSAESTAKVVEKQMDVDSGKIVCSGVDDVNLVMSVTSCGTTTASDCILTCDSLFAVSKPELRLAECPRSTTDATVTCSIQKLEQIPSVFSQSCSSQAPAVCSRIGSTDGLYVTKTVSCLNGGLSASSGDSDMELRPDILEGLSSVETDAGLSSLQSSPCSAELPGILDSIRESGTAITNGTDAGDIYHRHKCELVPSNSRLLHVGHFGDGSMSQHCKTADEGGSVKATLCGLNTSDISNNIGSDEDVATAADSTLPAVNLPCHEATSEASVASSNATTVLNSNETQTIVARTTVRSTPRHKQSAEVSANIIVTSGTCDIVTPQKKQTIVSVRSVTRMTTRSSNRTTAAKIDSSSPIYINQTKSAVRKVQLKSPEKQCCLAFKSSNRAPDMNGTSTVLVTQRRSARNPAGRVMDSNNLELVSPCQDSDSGISLRSRRHALKKTSSKFVTSRKRVSLRGTGDYSKHLDYTEGVVGGRDGSTGIEINVNDHDDNTKRLSLPESLVNFGAVYNIQAVPMTSDPVPHILQIGGDVCNRTSLTDDSEAFAKVALLHGLSATDNDILLDRLITDSCDV